MALWVGSALRRQAHPYGYARHPALHLAASFTASGRASRGLVKLTAISRLPAGGRSASERSPDAARGPACEAVSAGAALGEDGLPSPPPGSARSPAPAPGLLHSKTPHETSPREQAERS
jgi:hypothetical protein